MRFIERDTPEWNETWARLQDAINNNRLPGYNGGTVRTTLDDWMLMYLEANGTAAFKHRDTRNYIYVQSDGELVVPQTDSPWHRGVFTDGSWYRGLC